jgi:hypothetical protein
MIDLLNTKAEFLQSQGFKNVLFQSEAKNTDEIYSANNASIIGMLANKKKAIQHKITTNDIILSDIRIDVLQAERDLIDKLKELGFTTHTLGKGNDTVDKIIAKTTQIREEGGVDKLIVIQKYPTCDKMMLNVPPSSETIYIQSDFASEITKVSLGSRSPIPAGSLICNDINCAGKIEEIFSASLHPEL